MEDVEEAEEVIEVPDETDEGAAQAAPSVELNAPSGLQIEQVFARQVCVQIIRHFLNSSSNYIFKQFHF